jgi:D-beta-D-heptose 7-phosphate kinase/D-beta-D-heptose 1-phosphate adenosyltransferase
MMSIAFANEIDFHHMGHLCNIAAGIAIERLGCARVQLSDLLERLLELDPTNKIFDEEHLFALQQILRGKRYIILGLERSNGMSTAVFRSIRFLSTPQKHTKLIVYVRDSEPDEEFVSLLASLVEVDFIILKRESLKNVCEIIQPHQVFVIDKEQMVSLEHHSELFASSCF